MANLQNQTLTLDEALRIANAAYKARDNAGAQKLCRTILQNSPVAALLQRLNRHEEAIREYLAALTIAPGVGAWWIGLGISQEASNRGKEAAESLRRAKLTGTLNANLAAYADQRLRQLQ